MGIFTLKQAPRRRDLTFELKADPRTALYFQECALISNWVDEQAVGTITTYMVLFFRPVVVSAKSLDVATKH